jgi:hypothetical protein
VTAIRTERLMKGIWNVSEKYCVTMTVTVTAMRTERLMKGIWNVSEKYCVTM